MDAIFEKANEKMEKSINALKNDYAAVRAGRANANVLDKIMVDYYGTPTHINQMAAVSIAEARILVIQPWDVSTLHPIEKAIQISDIGINPQNDGKVIRLMFPQLTEDRRKEIVKEISKRAEDAKVSVRSIRRDCIESLKSLKKKSEITEDDLKDGETKLQKITDKFINNIEEILKAKEKEIMEI
ncbi:MAG: ribosome recycling factor [Oscillospiraceae bacterium]|jgi:ribosome recycling factor|nr:ribosome recycling factor [Oscillospiraceae bacterium]